MTDSNLFTRFALIPLKQFPMTSPLQHARGFGLYLHFPYCRHRCSYCDFFSSVEYSDDSFQTFGAAICAEIDREAEALKPNFLMGEVTSIFWGGGTPSLFPSSVMEVISKKLSQRWKFSPELEFTIEANPETVTQEKADAWRAIGINRVSLGVQSTSQKYLDLLDRRVSLESIPRAVQFLRQAGLRNFSCDLIFGIPDQTETEIEADIVAIAELNPRHISSYNLTLKPGHPLYKKLPDNDRSAALYIKVIQSLVERGYAQYEISNFATPGFESRHNLLYWSGGDFLGLGPSASTRFFKGGQFHHRKNVSDLKAYFDGKTPPTFEPTSGQQAVLESLFLELRKNEGVNLHDFKSRYGYAPDKASKFALYQRQGLLVVDGDFLRLTDRGRMLADSVTPGLLD